MTLSTQVPATVTIPLALVIGASVLSYWQRLGQTGVPESRRRIRRASIVLMLVALPVFVRALSFVDPDVHPTDYVVTWLLALVLIGLVLVTAGIDVVDTLRLHVRSRHDADDSKRIREAILKQAARRSPAAADEARKP